MEDKNIVFEGQYIKHIDIKDLKLWTENPRDPINNPEFTNQEIIERALDTHKEHWNLDKLAKEMESHYDYSEIPTVVYHKNKPIVYDGNRRIALAKIKYNLITIPEETGLNIEELPKFPEKIPCNVCEEKIALEHIARKHSKSGTWKQLERDIFMCNYNKTESTFLQLEKTTGIINAYPKLNQRFVKEEILTKENLNKMGFKIENNQLVSTHKEENAHIILKDIIKRIQNGEITTRSKRRNLFEVLDPLNITLIKDNKNKEFKPVNIRFNNKQEQQRQTKRTTSKVPELFGELLTLKPGDVNDLYRDIKDLYEHYLKKKTKFSKTFPSLIRMSLRLLCETAASEAYTDKPDRYQQKTKNTDIRYYIETHFKEAIDNLKAKNPKIKQDNSSYSINNKDKMVELLHNGAHNYQSSKDINQTLQLSINLGAILMITHKK